MKNIIDPVLLSVERHNAVKNPLKPTCIFFYIASAVYAMPLLFDLASGQSLDEVIKNHKVIMTFLCLSLVFIVSYHRRHILAFSIAMSVYPIIFLVRAGVKNCFPEYTAFLALLIVYLFSYYYLVPKRESYKEFIRANNRMDIGEQSKRNRSDLKCDIMPVRQNPLQTVLHVAIFLGVIDLSFLIFGEGGVLTNTQGALMVYRQHAVIILMTIAFCLLYWKKSIAAWWVAIFAGPATWVVYLLFQPLVIEVFLFSLIAEAGIIWYLVSQYRPYTEYIYESKTGKI